MTFQIIENLGKVEAGQRFNMLQFTDLASPKEKSNETNSGAMNFGKLKGKVIPGRNIVYFRRGLEELSLNITNACPNACTFCIRDRDAGWGVSNLYLTEDPTVEEIIRSFDFQHKEITLRGAELKKVKICGYGEPILRFDDILPIARHIREFSPNVNIQVTTTGWPYFRYVSADASRIGGLKKAGVSDIYLSLVATNETDYQRMVRPKANGLRSSAFKEAINFGTAAKDAGLKVTLGFMNLPGTKRDEIEKFANKLKMEYKIREIEE